MAQLMGESGWIFKSVQELDVVKTLGYLSPGAGTQDLAINPVALDRSFIVVNTYSGGWESPRAGLDGKFAFLDNHTVRFTFNLRHIQDGYTGSAAFHATVYELPFAPKSLQVIQNPALGANAIAQVDLKRARIYPGCFSGASNTDAVRRCYLLSATSAYFNWHDYAAYGLFTVVEP